VLTFQPLGTASPPNQFTSWAALYAEFLLTFGPVTIAIDVTFAPGGIATIAAGTWDFQGRATLTSTALNATNGGAQLAIPDGSIIQNLLGMDGVYGDIQLNTASTAVPPLQWTGTPFASFTVSNFAAFLQRGVAPVIRVPAGQTFFLVLNQEINFNSFPGGFGALVDLSNPSSSVALSSFAGLNLFLGAPGNFISGVAGSNIFYLYDSAWPGNPLNSSFAGTTNVPAVIDTASFVQYTPAVPANWPTPPTQVAQALDELAARGTRTIRIPISTATVSSIASIPAGTVVSRAFLDITTAYSVGATISVGTAASPALFITTGENIPQVVALYDFPQDTQNAVADSLLVTIAGGPVSGAGFAFVEYSTPQT
jgi:hypothetical protein